MEMVCLCVCLVCFSLNWGICIVWFCFWFSSLSILLPILGKKSCLTMKRGTGKVLQHFKQVVHLDSYLECVYGMLVCPVILVFTLCYWLLGLA